MVRVAEPLLAGCVITKSKSLFAVYVIAPILAASVPVNPVVD